MPRPKKRVTTESVTSKLDAERLKRAISRRRAAQAVTHLYDPSVPQSLLFYGLKKQPAREAEITVSEHPQHVSPFVIYLNHTYVSPETVLEAEGAAPLLVNFLHGEEYLLTDASADQPSDLALTREDVASQIAEDSLRINTPSGSNVRITVPKGAIRTRYAHAFAPPVEFVSTIESSSFAPPEAPKNILSLFDLPEKEEGSSPESDVLDLHELRTISSAPALKAFAPRQRSTGWKKAVGAFAILAFLFVLPLHLLSLFGELQVARADVGAASGEALTNFSAGARAALAKDPSSAAAAFAHAREHFNEAQGSIDALGAGTALILNALPGASDKYQAGTSLLIAGEALSRAGELISEGLDALSEPVERTPTEQLALLSTYVESALPHVATAERELGSIQSKDLPASERETFELITNELPALSASLHELVEFASMAQVILGTDGTKKYLIVFQNNTELRATGGFMGSFAEMTVRDGVIVDMHVPGGGTYDLQGSLRQNIIAPRALQLLSARWEFQDANWFPDFPTSARHILSIWSSAGGPSVDGVIAVNATFVQELLAILGPVDMEAYGRTIDAENFLFETQKIVELEYDREENTPKAFIGDLAPKLLDRSIEQAKEDPFTLLDHINKGLSQKDIQIYFADDALQRKMISLGWAGETKQTDGDFLMIVNSNLGGGKTDTVIDEDVQLSVHIEDDGSITNTVEFTRTHFGIQGTLFSGVNNVNYVRLYVPKGSTLLSAEGFAIPPEELFERPSEDWILDDDLLYSEFSGTTDPQSKTDIWQESGKTVFGNWMQTKPGTSATIRFTYRLPFKIDTLQHDQSFTDKIRGWLGFPTTDAYSLFVQKQSGVQHRKTTVRVSVPSSYDVVWSSDEPEGIQFSNQADGFFAALLETSAK